VKPKDALQSDERASERIGRVRALRAGRGAARTLAPELHAQVGFIARQHRSLGVVGERWGSLVPGGLAGRVWPESSRRGVLTVRAADAASGFEFDRWLRAGGDGVLRTVGVRGVRVAPG